MNIRSLTSCMPIYKGDTTYSLDSRIYEFSKNILKLKAKLPNCRTIRLVIKYLDKFSTSDLDELKAILNYICKKCPKHGIRWVHYELNCQNDYFDYDITELTTALIRDNENLFIHLNIGVHPIEKKLQEAALAIIKVSRLSSNGFANFRLGVSNGMAKETPFFPYSSFSKINSYSIGVESIDYVINSFEKQISKLNKIDMNKISEGLAKELKHIDEARKSIETSLSFMGFDISLAPIPRSKSSLGYLLDMMGTKPLGAHGTISNISSLTLMIKNSLKLASVKSVGFNGVMLSPLEDDILSSQSRNQAFSIDSLLLFSTVCGCGLDMVPVPGDILDMTIINLIKDLITLSNRLAKPLGLRILPIPGKMNGENTSFNHDFLDDMRIMMTSTSISKNY